MRSSSPLSRPGKGETLNSLNPLQHRTSSPSPRLVADTHVTAQSGACGSRGRCAGSRGRPSLTWQTALDEVRKMDKAKPSFMQSLRTRSLSPQSQGAECKAKAVSQPVWQKYEKHATPDRVLARPAPTRRGLQGMSRTAPGRHAQQGRAFCKEAPEAAPSGLDHVPNQAPSVMSQSAKEKIAHRAPAKEPTQALPGMPWSPAGKALAPRAYQAEKPSKPPAQVPSGKVRIEAQQEGTSGIRSGAMLSQPRPIRAGQQALAALLSKQAAWEQTRSSSLPPVMSQITSLLHRKSESVHSPPARSAQELISANPELGQLVSQPTTAVDSFRDQWQGWQPEANAAVVASEAPHVVAQPHDSEAVGQEAAVKTYLNLSPAEIPPSALQPSSSSASRTLKTEYQASCADQIQAALESEAQLAKHGAAHSGGNYFQVEGYFQEAARAVGNEAEEGTSHSLEQEEAEEGTWHDAEQAELLSEAAEEEETPLSVEGEASIKTTEAEKRQDTLETLCDAGELWRDSQLHSLSILSRLNAESVTAQCTA